MGRNTGDDYRIGAVKNRVQKQLNSGHWAKLDPETMKVIDVKTSNTEPFKGVAQVKDGRRSG